MAFSIIENPGRTFWASTDGSSTYYVGQIVVYAQATTTELAGTVAPLLFASGAADTTLKQIIAGVVVGINDRTPVYDSTNGLQYITGVTTQAALAARDYTGQEGMYSKGEKQALVQITEILPNTVIQGSIYNATWGTAPTLLTNTASDTTGGTSAYATNTAQATNVANCGTMYCRTGANAGLYRVDSAASATAPANTVAFPYDIAVGDTFVYVPFKQGNSNIAIGVSGDGTASSKGTFVNCDLDPVIAGTNLFNVVVYKLDLATAGSETVEFRFGADHFTRFRA